MGLNGFANVLQDIKSQLPNKVEYERVAKYMGFVHSSEIKLSLSNAMNNLRTIKNKIK